ncbi:MAG: alanine racemase [Bacilli bacterium]|nr:alanine racemase [Bacilli bacterium]
MSKIYRKTYAEIHLPNIYENYTRIQKKLPTKTIIPVVKANAYGHGVLEVVRYLVDKNINYFAVSLLEEAIEIRKVFPQVNILIMGYVQREYFDVAALNNFTITIANMNQLDDIVEFDLPLKVHLKIDTGMNRLGFKMNRDIIQSFSILKEHHSIHLEGIYTHFATADGSKEEYDKQLSRFKEVLQLLNYDFEMVHISNSSSMIKYENEYDFTTHTRLGISLYGLTLDQETTFLLNTYRLISQFAEIKHLKPGEKVGYGFTYTAVENEIIGVLPIGYADGFIRQNQGGDVEIRDKRYQIIGRICMDQMFVRIDKSVTLDDQVIIFGGLISIDEVAERLHTINYEVVCQITSRVPKKYIYNEGVVL